MTPDGRMEEKLYFEQCHLARDSHCSPTTLEKLWEIEMDAYRHAGEHGFHICAGIMSSIAGNPNTPAWCLREASTHEYPAVHIVALGNRSTPLDAVVEHLQAYKWCALFAVVYRLDVPRAVLQHIAEIPEDVQGKEDFNAGLRNKARERLGILEPKEN